MKTLACGLLLGSLLLVGCGGDNDNTASTQISYEITVTNLTNNQPLSPTGFAIHDSSYTSWTSGAPATEGLEVVAESGDNTTWLAEASTALVTGSSTGVLLPGASASTTLTFNSPGTHSLTTASMLVNTNDAFTGVSSEQLDSLERGDTLTIVARVYDAGTEQNTETQASIPGPAANGSGFDAEREVLDRITVHPGVVTVDDGLTSSALNESHRFDQGAQLIKISRTL